MGQQQMLFIVLGILVVGVAVAIAITMFTEGAVSANRDAITNDLLDLSVRAQQYYRRPKSMAGGGDNFSGLKMGALSNAAGSNSSFTNVHGTFTLTSVTSTQIVLSAVGIEPNGMGNLVSVEMHITSTRMDTTIVVN
jgi:Tfp pilus assembly protein PilE